MAESKKPFWRTVPGVLTQIAGIVTALGAIAGVEAIERRYLLTRNAQSYSRGEFQRQYNTLRKKIGDENERGDALAVQLGATVCAQEPY